MAQNVFDQLSKQYLEEFLAPIGTVQRQYEIPGEAKFVDVWFVPDPNRVQSDLGLLGRMAQSSCLLEPYRNAPTRTEVRVSVMKLIWIQEDERRKSEDRLSEVKLPTLWLLAATSFRPLLEEAGCTLKPDWMQGVYFMADLLKTAIVVIDQLPETEETLWLRVLGRDATQERAIREVLALPLNHPWRERILRLLASWKVRIDLGEIENFTEQEALMALSEAFLRWEQQHDEQLEQRVRRQQQQEIARNLLKTNLSLEAIAEVTGLEIGQLQQLQAQLDA
ncbi:flagellar assembly protein H [Leptolyngbya sp. AN03gr2]|uniref:flagellar assembly protein H n=1 Tax=unclassified Leptolyngbya TaxID=2650499 RepID=UPI003D31DCDA